MVGRQGSGCQQLLLYVDLSLGNEELVSGEHMLVPFGEVDALRFNPKTKSTAVSWLSAFQRWRCYQQGLEFNLRPVVAFVVTMKQRMTKTRCNLPLPTLPI